MDQKTGQSGSLGFKPLTEGLGLNHFADGLPYTPAHVKKKPTFQFNYPSPGSMPRSEQPLAQAPAGTTSAQKMIEQFESASAATEEVIYAGIVRRMLAYGIDLVLAAGVFAAIVWISFTINGYDPSRLFTERMGSQVAWPLALLYAVVHMGYFLVQETTWRRTMGKALLGIRIKAQSGFATVGRAVCFLVAAAPLGIGLLWCLFDSRRRCWHDVITDSGVVRDHHDQASPTGAPRNHETGLFS